MILKHTWLLYIRPWLYHLRNPHERRAKGPWGELLAARFLAARGLAILHMNLRSPHGELDIIARDQDTWVFVEVKSRTRPIDDMMPQQVLFPYQQRRIRKAAAWFLDRAGKPCAPMRFDLVLVALPRHNEKPLLRHIPHAWHPPVPLP